MQPSLQEQQQQQQAVNISNISTTPPVPVVSLEIQLTSVLLGLCCAVGLPGNAMVLNILWEKVHTGCFTLCVMLNLAISDLLTLLTLPLWIYTLLHGFSFGQVTCKLLSYMVYCSLYTSVLCVTLLCVQRYVQVLHPQSWSKLTASSRRILVATVWVLGAVTSCHALVQREVRLGEKDGLLHCLPRYRSVGEEVATLLVESLLLFVLPFSVLASLYVTLHRRVKQAVGAGHRRMKRLVISIIVVFFIFSIPVHLNNFLTIMAVSLGSPSLLRITKVTGGVTGAMTFLNSCVNPLLYAFSHRALRRSSVVKLPSFGPQANSALEASSSGNTLCKQ
ncbi:leukotriene B4 receptor 1-like [Engraulis encrasicolus]|uniref:leukotriene B4 receptor 1-like n=1 Tax=Engraulis encrasicolus TaxID=184585 RepID=UPI002FD1010E